MAEESEKPLCFVIMPFGGHYDLYYEVLYKPAIINADLIPKRADEIYSSGRIIDDIWKFTKQAKIVLADLTERNPNVLYELGLAHAIGKQAILITESAEDIPFDLKALRHIVYDKNIPNWGEKLQLAITSSIRTILNSPLESVLPIFLDIQDIPERPVISKLELELYKIRDSIESLRSEIQEKETVKTKYNALLKTIEKLKEVAQGGLENSLDVNIIVRQCVDLLSGQISKYTENFQVHYGEDIPFLSGHLLKLEQVVINLIMNALESLTDKNKGVRVITEYDKDAEQVVIKIIDEGIGMSQETLARAPNPFFTTKTFHEGLGLTVSIGAIKEHNGTLKINSRPGGTTVTIRLPVKAKNPVNLLEKS
ncbi:MAG: hypothetical protein K8I01_12990 [Candidatus Methylomirabilis sp.]|nr:hypothetical protein [Deltaproteobacteria bacterium]